MSLHVDVFFFVKNDQICKRTYFTVIYRCDQGLTDVLSIADVVLDEFKKDVPHITHVFVKSDNASCYHSNSSAEGLHQVCKEKGIKLARYDYNEPCRGKDQCDRESAGAKSVMRSYVDAGNDILTATDIFKALHYGTGLKNAKVILS